MLNSCGNIDVVYSAPPQLKIVTETEDCGDITFEQPKKINLICNPLGSDGGLDAVDVQSLIAASLAQQEHNHVQQVASAEWVINHNLNKRPLIEVYDSAGNEWIGRETHVNLNQTIINFNVPFSGTARLI